MNLLEIRDQLDGIDAEIVRLFEERMKLVEEVAEFKIGTGKQVFDAEREKAKIEAVRSLAHSEDRARDAEELFTQLMTISRRMQYRLLQEHGRKTNLGFTPVETILKKGVQVAYQGVEGAFGHSAALRYFGEDSFPYHVKTFEDAMEAVERGEADYCMIPIENSSAGAVSANFDSIAKYQNTIVGELYLPVSQCLLGLPGTGPEEIRRVYSHPQALMQSAAFLNAHKDWEQFSMENTAVAAKKVVAEQDRTQAAVASREAAKLYGLEILKEDINQDKNNTTRFLVLAKAPIYQQGAGKISLCFELPHRYGTLYNALGHFTYNGISMLMVESRPIPGKAWEYRFFVDIEGSLSDPAVQNALMGIFQETRNPRILGNY